jgi:hypothetical protein
MRRLVSSVALVLLCAALANAQSEAEARSQAADVAAYVASQADSVTVPSSRPGETADAKAQAYVDRLGTLAGELETQLRAGADKARTRETYLEMRRVRLDLIAYAMNEGVELPQTEGRLFEQMLGELGRYHRGE